MREQGWSLQRIAQQLGITPATVGNDLRRMGWTEKGKAKRTGKKG